MFGNENLLFLYKNGRNKIIIYDANMDRHYVSLIEDDGSNIYKYACRYHNLNATVSGDVSFDSLTTISTRYFFAGLFYYAIDGSSAETVKNTGITSFTFPVLESIGDYGLATLKE